jgi:hypothetical protein
MAKTVSAPRLCVLPEGCSTIRGPQRCVECEPRRRVAPPKRFGLPHHGIVHARGGADEYHQYPGLLRTKYLAHLAEELTIDSVAKPTVFPMILSR